VSERRLTEMALPASIVLGSVLISWVVHRDLTEVASAVREAAAKPGPNVVAPAATPAPSGLASLATASPEIIAQDRETRAREHAQTLLNEQRPTYLSTCRAIDATTGKHAVPAVLTVDFDGQGKEVRRGIRPIPILAAQMSAFDKRVHECAAQGDVPKLSIEPLGKPMSVELSLPFQ
jgi:hypothetical protein